MDANHTQSDNNTGLQHVLVNHDMGQRNEKLVENGNALPEEKRGRGAASAVAGDRNRRPMSEQSHKQRVHMVSKINTTVARAGWPPYIEQWKIMVRSRRIFIVCCENGVLTASSRHMFEIAGLY